jgi:hypothetical protein
VSVLVDTSVWVEHFKQRNDSLVALLEAGLVQCHPFVVVEIACGTPPSRAAVAGMLAELQSTPVATPAECLDLIERQGLHGRGCGFVDVSLLASALLAGQTLLWTLDKRLQVAAAELGLNYRPSLQS